MSMFDEGVRLFSMVDIKSIETHSTSLFMSQGVQMSSILNLQCYLSQNNKISYNCMFRNKWPALTASRESNIT